MGSKPKSQTPETTSPVCSPILTEPQRARAVEAFKKGLRPLRVERPLRASEWAERHFWLSPESSAIEGRFRAWPYQTAILDCMGNDDIRTVTFRKSARIGYALSLETPLPTPDGWTTMGAVEVGDQLLDENGAACTVEYKSPIYRDHECYQLTFCDGSSVVADAGHRWYVESDVALDRLLENGRTGRRPDNPSFRGVVDTQTIAASLGVHKRTKLAIPNAQPIVGVHQDLPIPPYVLGAWLGDGHRVTPRITAHRSDADEMAAHLELSGVPCRVEYIDSRYPDNGTILLDPRQCARYGVRSGLAPVIRELGLTKAKHVPGAYLRASVEQRLELLRGLMDTDGTITAGGRAEFTNTNLILSSAVYELVCSLGMKASLRHRPPQRDGVLEQWRVNFKPEPRTNPFRLRRKADRVIAPERPTITRRRRIVAAEKVAAVSVQCVQVSSSSSLFLAGRQMVPTHNTKMVAAVTGYFHHHKRRNVVIYQPTDDDAKEFSKDTIDPMIRDCPVMEELLASSSKNNKENTLSTKFFLGSSLHIRGGKSANNYRRLTKDVVIYDELDGFEPDVDGEGSPTALGDKRVQDSSFPKSIRGTTPTVYGRSLIQHSEEEADLAFRYGVICHHCDERQPFEWGGKDADYGFKWDDHDPETAHYVCRYCHGHWHYHDLPSLQVSGRWEADGHYIDSDSNLRLIESDEVVEWPRHVAFIIWSAYSMTFPWPDMVHEFVNTMDDPASLKTFVNTTLGELWRDASVVVEADPLLARREAYRQAPAETRVITFGADVQVDRIECEFVAWGAGEESWSLDHVILPGDTQRPEVWAALEREIKRKFLVADGRELRSRLGCVDSGYLPDEVYKFARRNGVQFVFPVKGSSIPGRAVANFPRRLHAEHRVYLTEVGSDTAKETIYRRLLMTESGRGFMHYPNSDPYDDEYFRQLTGEEKRPVKRQGRTTMAFQQTYVRVEALDCRVYNLAAVRIAQQRFRVSLDGAAPVAPDPTPPTDPRPTTTAKTTPPTLSTSKRQKTSGWMNRYRKR